METTMPGPDPEGLEIEERADGSFTISGSVWWYGNRRARIARMRAIARQIRFNGWKCRWCSAPIPLWRRADARFCCEGCRKRDARQRRDYRGTS